MAAASEPQSASIVLALGGGGARGLAQIGVIEVLLARGMEIEAVAGTSCGALVGGAFAAGKLDELRDWMERTSRREMLRLLDPGLGRPAMFTGTRLVRALREVVGEPRIEDLPIDFTAVAVDLMRQREVWLRRGDLWDALRASFAIPGIFTPLNIGGMELVDGGLLAPLPITATRLAGAHRVVAVDIHGSTPQRRDEPVRVVDAEAGAPAVGLLGRWMDRLGEEAAKPVHRFGLMEVMSRALDTMQERIARVQLALEPPELLIRIPRDACQFYEFWRASELIDIGRREAEKALDAAGY
ncbi:patatin-like phospholipase family protein [Thermomonas fusca]|uniref:patatin-like phospholipase family protein n=1 Tax=Thermomonas fusca TaxID=215690 RepID=UPI0014868706|nr:patatin-like phospholipase family protein [Thermomonas fusca]